MLDIAKLREIMERSLVIPTNPSSVTDIALKHLREYAGASDEFLEETKNLPDGTVIRMGENGLSLVADSDGNILSFR